MSSLVSGLFASPKIRVKIGICFLMLLSIQSYGQEDWLLQSSIDGVEVYSRIADCDDESVVFLKFINSNDQTVSISWDEEFTFEGESDFRSVNPSGHFLDLEPGEVVGNACEEAPILQLVSRPTVFLSASNSEDVNAMANTQNGGTAEGENLSITAFRIINLSVAQD